MKIAFISVMGGTPWGGSEELWRKTALLALKAGHEVLISTFKWTPTHPNLNELKTKGAKTVFRELPENYFKNKNIWKRIVEKLLNAEPIFKREIKEIESFAADIYVVNEGGTFDLFAFPHLEKFLHNKSNIIVHQLNKENYIPTQEIIQKAQIVYSKVFKHVFVAAKNKLTTEKQIALSLPNSLIIYNPPSFDISLIRKSRDKSKGQSVNFSIVGRLECNHKGHHLLLEILKGDVWTERQWHLNVYGSGPHEKYLRSLSQYYEIGHRVTFHGFIEDKETIWLNNDILLLPSLYEGTPLVLVESMFFGVTSVINDVGGCSEISIDNETTFLSKSPNQTSFGNALERAWQNQGNWNEMGLRAKKHITKLYKKLPEEKMLQLIESYSE